VRVIVVDYGMGNLWSVVNALQYLGANARTSANPSEISEADALVLPGVGSFRTAMQALRERGLDEAIHEAVDIRGKKILGVCLGFQMLAQFGTEDGREKGLGYLPGTVEHFSRASESSLKLPHIGFNRVYFSDKAPLFRGLESGAYFYFVHSYRLLTGDMQGEVATANHGETFVSAYSQGNIFGTQFHPEKSQTNGLILLRNFLDSQPC
jgi:imidazole glycerol-phosphate synthase subunit HisH